MDKTVIIAGVGCRRGTAASEIEELIREALDRAGLAAGALAMIAAPAAKRHENGIVAAATTLGVPLVCIAPEDLASASVRATTISERVMRLAGVSSVAEAAALAAGGPAARLLLPRIARARATCALAHSSPSP